MSNRTGRAEIWKLPATGGEPLQVTTAGGHVALESPDGQTLFFTKAQGGSLWKMPAGGGPETRVLDRVNGRNFVPASDGIYFMAVEERVYSLRFLEFATGSVRPIRALPRSSSNIITLSADGRWLAYVQLDHAGSDIVLVENFR